jgi:hypothetical protein
MFAQINLNELNRLINSDLSESDSLIEFLDLILTHEKS